MRAYVSLGSNLGDSRTQVKTALERIASLPGVTEFKASRYFQTTPVSKIPQGDYINAACAFVTTYSPEELLSKLQEIETSLGKVAKAKDAPRKIDLDILFYGTAYRDKEELCIPHPKWKERLFVLAPLLDLTETITFPIDKNGHMETLDLVELLKSFPNRHGEHVFALN
ncbi:MAG: 2-amino-4-hydroxy-6-hydroxymethyldihydropteridine diphosphokinase [Verrucomicrobia bacterium]|nr:2-amino-4-hydroxy-6-hydroxymethyldihydropteridine diphosphokinase [Verrucomicrobiota bacterium]